MKSRNRVGISDYSDVTFGITVIDPKNTVVK